MKIQCKLERSGGSHIDIGGVNYHFAPNAKGQHVAEVTDKEHIHRFLAIPEGYQIADDEEEIKSPLVKQPKMDAGNDNNNSDTGGDAGNQNEKTGDDGEDEEAADAAAAERAELVAKHLAKFGTKPHHKVSNDSIRAKLAEQASE